MSPPMMSHPLTMRDIGSSVNDVKQTFTSWDGCMAKAYCKWPVIAAIIIGTLILLSILTCVARCLCCGMECCCGCFRCCNACCPSPRRSRDKYQPAPGMPNAGYPQPYAYQPHPPMHYGAGALATPDNGKKNFATFESASKPANEDALPAMPSWSNAKETRVEVEDDPIPVEEKNSIPLKNQKSFTEEAQPMLQSPQPVAAAGLPHNRSPSPFHRPGDIYNQSPYTPQSPRSPASVTSPFHPYGQNGEHEQAAAGAAGVAGAAGAYYVNNARSPPPGAYPNRAPPPNAFSPRTQQGMPMRFPSRNDHPQNPQYGMPPGQSPTSEYSSHVPYGGSTRSPPPPGYGGRGPPPGPGMHSPYNDSPSGGYQNSAMPRPPQMSSPYAGPSPGPRGAPTFDGTASPVPAVIRPGNPRSPPPAIRSPPPPQQYHQNSAYAPYRGAQEMEGSNRSFAVAEAPAEREAVEAPTSRMTMQPVNAGWAGYNGQVRRPGQGPPTRDS